MLETIKSLIDNEKLFLDDFIAMAKDAEDRYELADWLEDWFEDAIEYEKIEVVAKDIAYPETYRKSYRHVFQFILRAAIDHIPESDWLAMADYYIAKANESKGE